MKNVYLWWGICSLFFIGGCTQKQINLAVPGVSKELAVYRKASVSDLKYKLDNIVNLKVENPEYELTKLDRLKAAVYFKIQKNDYMYYKQARKEFLAASKTEKEKHTWLYEEILGQ